MIKKLKSTKQAHKRTKLFFIKMMLLPLLFSSCQLINKISLKTHVKSISNEIENLPKSFTGLSVYDLDQNKYLIKRDELLLKDFQTKVLRYKGISRINTKNIYHINNKSDIIIQIYLDLYFKYFL